MDAETDGAMRRIYARNLAKAVARNNLHSTLMRADDGVAPIVIALGHEKVDVVFERIEAAGGAANLFVVDSNEDVHIIRMTPREVDVTASGDAEPDAVHKNITMDFLVMYMKDMGGQGQLRIAFDGIGMTAATAEGVDLAGIG